MKEGWLIKQHLAKGARGIAALFVGLILSGAALANPVLSGVSDGSATVQQTENVTTINQTSSNAIINWQSFNISKGQQTNFVQPTNGVALNRISPSQGASSIYGSLTSTGQIILVNQAGIYFGP